MLVFVPWISSKITVLAPTAVVIGVLKLIVKVALGPPTWGVTLPLTVVFAAPAGPGATTSAPSASATDTSTDTLTTLIFGTASPPGNGA